MSNWEAWKRFSFTQPAQPTIQREEAEDLRDLWINETKHQSIVYPTWYEKKQLGMVSNKYFHDSQNLMNQYYQYYIK